MSLRKQCDGNVNCLVTLKHIANNLILAPYGPIVKLWILSNRVVETGFGDNDSIMGFRVWVNV